VGANTAELGPHPFGEHPVVHVVTNEPGLGFCGKPLGSMAEVADGHVHGVSGLTHAAPDPVAEDGAPAVACLRIDQVHEARAEPEADEHRRDRIH
jgi:hypothetical protein